MKRSAKKALSLFLCAMLCMSLLPAAAFAENEVAETEPIAAELPENAGLLREEPAAKAPAPAEETSGTRAEPESAAEPEKTGTDKVLTAVHSGEGAALAQEENGDNTITSFAELKALAAQEYTESVGVYYEGTEPFIFEEDLTLPENLSFYALNADIRIPSGVTVTVNYVLDCAGTLYVEGSLIANGTVRVGNINVSGSLMANAGIVIPGTGTITGEENIVFGEGSNTTGFFSIYYDVASINQLKAAVQEANLNKPNRLYSIDLFSQNDTITLEEELTLGANTRLTVWSPFVVAESGTLSVDSDLYVASAVTINGSLINMGIVSIPSWNEDDRSLTLGETGSYSGTGEILVRSGSLSSPGEVLPGFDLSQFNVYSWQQEEEKWWSLRLKRSLADGPDEYGNYYVADFAELKQISEWEFTEYTAVYYEGTEEFVFEEDLTLPENVHFITRVDTIVPSGVTVTANGMLIVGDGTLYVEGTLVAKDVIALQNINVSGTLTAYSNINIPSTGMIVGEENIVFGGGLFSTGVFRISYVVDSIDQLKEAVQEANLNKPNRTYSIELWGEDPVTIEDELVLGANADLFLGCPFVIAESGSLSVSAGMAVYNHPVTINGSLTNTGSIDVSCWDDRNPSLSLGETGSYSGTGEIVVRGGNLSSPGEVLPGFDLSRFNVYSWQLEEEKWWSLRLKRSLADGPDEYGNYYVADFAELKQISEREFTEYTAVYYEGTEEFVVEENLTVPENMDFISYNADIRIPSGVTVTVNGALTCWGDTFFVEGALAANGDIYVDQNINVSGSVQCKDKIWINYYGEIAGEENICFEDGAHFFVQSWIYDQEDFAAVLQEANLGKPNRKYLINLGDNISVTIEGETTIPQNTEVTLWNEETITVAQGGTLNIEGVLSCGSTYVVDMSAEKGVHSLIVNGTLNNSGTIYVSVNGEANYTGELVLGETGTYSGTGVIEVYSDTLSSPDEALPGFDLTEFNVVNEGDGRWTLTLKTAEETIPGDANGDGEVNTMDLIRLMKYISGAEVDMAEGAGDVNGDGKVNTMDLIRLMKIINGESV